MIARKILGTHMSQADEHAINEIVEKMARKLYFHGHPINRAEAKNEIGLKITLDLPPELETTMWDLYKDYEEDFENLSVFQPLGELLQVPVGPALPQKEYSVIHAIIESRKLSSAFKTQRRYTLLPAGPATPGQLNIREDVLSQGWNHSQVP